MLTSIKWQSVAYIPTSFLSFSFLFSVIEKNSYLHFSSATITFVCLPLWQHVAWLKIENEEKWRINVFAENRLNIAAGIVIFATFYHQFPGSIVTSTSNSKWEPMLIWTNDFVARERCHFQFIHQHSSHILTALITKCDDIPSIDSATREERTTKSIVVMSIGEYDCFFLKNRSNRMRHFFHPFGMP